jgi:MarR family transcriptional repressor of emrRAB
MHHRSVREANVLGAAALATVDRLHEHLAGSVAALVHVRLRPGQTIDFLARVLGLSHSATVRLVDRLEAAELLERRPGGDGRSLALFVTPLGDEAAVDALHRRGQALAEALAPLSTSERHQLTALLERILAGMTGDRWSARRICRLCDFPACTRGDNCPVDQAAQGEGIPVAPCARRKEA